MTHVSAVRKHFVVVNLIVLAVGIPSLGEIVAGVLNEITAPWLRHGRLRRDRRVGRLDPLADGSFHEIDGDLMGRLWTLAALTHPVVDRRVDPGSLN